MHLVLSAFPSSPISLTAPTKTSAFVYNIGDKKKKCTLVVVDHRVQMIVWTSPMSLKFQYILYVHYKKKVYHPENLAKIIIIPLS
jgi:hypothetical protein